MSLPGIRPVALDDHGGAWCDHLSEDGGSPQQKQQPTGRLNEASPDRPSRGQTHVQQFRQSRRPSSSPYTQAIDSGGASNGRLKRNKPVKWSVEEDRRLREAVNKFDEARWKDIASQVETRNHVQCLQRWKKVLKPGLVKGQWSPEEDDRLVSLVERGYRNWGQVASYMEGRTSKQCRERWCHHLDPAVRKGGYTAEEDELIVFLQSEVGNRWADIAKRLTGRTENAVKIRWKALNRRQRDARNKAAAAAVAAATSGSSGMHSTPSARTGGRESTRSAARAAARAVARETPSRRSTNMKEGVGVESVSKQEPSTRGSKPSPPSARTCLHPATSSAQSSAIDEQTAGADHVRQSRTILKEKHVKEYPASSATGALRSLAFAPALDSVQYGRRTGSSDATADAPGARAAVDAIMKDEPSEQEPQPAGSTRVPHPTAEGLHRLCAALRNVEAMSSLQEPRNEPPPSTTITGALDKRTRSSTDGRYNMSSRIPLSPGHETRGETWDGIEYAEKPVLARQSYERGGGGFRSLSSPSMTLPPPAEPKSTTASKHNGGRFPPRLLSMPISSYAREPTKAPYISGVHRSMTNSESPVVHSNQARMDSPRRGGPSPLTMAAEVWTGLSRPGMSLRNGPEVMAAAVASAAPARPRAMEAEDARRMAQETQGWGEPRREMHASSRDGTPAALSRSGFLPPEFVHDARRYASAATVVNEDPAFVEDDANMVGMKHSRARDIAPEELRLDRPPKKACSPSP